MFTFEETIWNSFKMDDYVWLLNNVHLITGTPQNVDAFGKKFGSFFKTTVRNQQWKRDFLNQFIAAYKNKYNLTIGDFSTYLNLVYNACTINGEHKMEVSFTSKMLHLIRPDIFPIFDSRSKESIKRLIKPSKINCYANFVDAVDKVFKGKTIMATFKQIQSCLSNLASQKGVTLSDYKIMDIILYQNGK